MSATPPPTDGPLERALLTLASLIGLLGGLVWTVSQLAARALGPPHAAGRLHLEDLPGVLVRLPHTLADPRAAWPPAARAELPGPAGMWLTTLLVLAILLVLTALVWPTRHGGPGGRLPSWWKLRRLLTLHAQPGRVIVGRRDHPRDRLLRRPRLATEAGHALLVFGPPGSYKTSGLVIPTILEWAGNLIATSVKLDVLRATAGHRARQGPVWVYDPLGASGVPAARWSPLSASGTFGGARRIARMLADAADLTGIREADQSFWQLLGAKLLSVLLYAAARTGKTMTDVARWVDVQEFDEIAYILAELGDQQAMDAWAACRTRPAEMLGSVYGTAETILDLYGDPTIAASAAQTDIDVGQLVSGTGASLYLYAPANQQARLRPLFEVLAGWVISQAEDHAARQPAGRLPVPLLVALDEAGNCAPLASLPGLATTGPGQGITLLTVWHDEAQLAHRYGKRAATVLNGHRGRLWLAGQADPASLELAARLLGRSVCPPEQLRQLRPRRGLLIYGHLPAVRVRLRPWWRESALRRRARLPLPVEAVHSQLAVTGQPARLTLPRASASMPEDLRDLLAEAQTARMDDMERTEWHA